MSVTVNFYVNNSDRRVAQKDLTLIASKACEFKGDVSVTSPVLIVTGDAATYAACNYMEIGVFGRKYFATVRALPGGLIEASGEVDVLSSAWDAIKDNKAVIERQEHAYNLKLNDGTFQAYANDAVICKDFPADKGFKNPSYVLIVAG